MQTEANTFATARAVTETPKSRMPVTNRALPSRTPKSAAPATQSIIPSDPLVDAIAAYRQGMKAFCAIPENEDYRKNEERYIAETYGAAQDALLWVAPPTTTHEGVKEALRFALDEGDVGCRMSRNALRSALAYLEALA